MATFEKELRQKGFKTIAGVDEAGRGPLAGPVVAAACILPENYQLAGLNDSKKLTKKLRKSLYEHLIQDVDVCFSVAIVDAKTIDEINILQASLLAMKNAVEALEKSADYILIDGTHAFKTQTSYECLVKGDSRSISIAAASIIAKELRDEKMLEMHESYPEYHFDEHKGYGTAKHIAALKKHGPTPIHRKSFAPIKALIN